MAFVAVQCSINVYNDESPDLLTGPFHLHTKHSVPVSSSGVVKETRFVEVTSSSPHSQDFPALVVAIRGTRPSSITDWLVNFNHDI